MTVLGPGQRISTHSSFAGATEAEDFARIVAREIAAAACFQPGPD